MDKKITHSVHNYTKKRLGPTGFEQNSIAFCEHLNILCLGDKNGLLYLVSSIRGKLIKRIQFNQTIAALKYVKQEKSLFIASGPNIYKYDFKKCKITFHKGLDFWPGVIEYIGRHDVIAVAGDTFGTRFYNMSLAYQFSINYKDTSRMVGSLMYLEKQLLLIIGLDNGTIVAYDMKSTRLLSHDNRQKTMVNYLKYIDKEDIIISGGEEGKLYMRQFSRYEGFKSRDCLWMKKQEILGIVPLKDNNCMACIHADNDSLSIIRIKDWQLMKSIPLFFNKTGGTNLLSMNKGHIIAATEKGEGFYYLIKCT